MSGVSTVIGLDALVDSREVSNALRRLSGMPSERAMFDGIGGALHALTIDRFLTSTTPGGDDWEPSARALAEGGKTLVDHALLRDSFAYQHIGGDGIEYGSGMDYAAIHQCGGEAGPRSARVHLDARPMLPDEVWPTEYLIIIGDIVIDHMSRSLQ